MASRLLKVLEHMHLGRDLCVTALANKGYPTTENMSFESIASTISGIESEHFPHYVDTGISNYTEETDPAFYHRPADFPDIEEIFLNQADITDDNNLTYKPESIILFNSNQSTSNFFIDTNTIVADSTDRTLTDNNIKVGYKQGNATQYGLLIKTSDGATFRLDGVTDSHLHTWDTTKDIVTQDYPNLRYIIIFKQVHWNAAHTTSYSNNYQSLNFTTVDVIECLFNYCRLNSVWMSETANYCIVSKDIQFCKFISPHTPLGIETCPKYNFPTSGYNATDLSPYFKTNTLIIELTEGLNSFPADRFCIPQYVIYYKSNTPYDARFGLTNNLGYNGPTTVEYISVPHFWDSASGNNTAQFSNLRYLYITDETAEIDVCRLRNMPALVHTNLFERITRMNLAGEIQDIAQNMRYIYFENLEEIYGSGRLFYSYYKEEVFEVLAFPKLTQLANINIDAAVVKLMLPQVTHMQSVTLPKSLHQLYVPSLTSLLAADGVTLPDELYSVIASSLETCDVPTAFNKSDLHELVLPQGFKYSLNLNSTGLTLTGLRNIIDYMGTLDTPNSCYIQLSDKQKGKLGPVWLNKITEKGWELR